MELELKQEGEMTERTALEDVTAWADKAIPGADGFSNSELAQAENAIAEAWAALKIKGVELNFSTPHTSPAISIR